MSMTSGGGANGANRSVGTMPRPEYPRPQFVRDDWLNLNGVWQFEIDRGDSGLERGLLERQLERTILVPFAPESELSGVAETDFLQAVWYRLEIEVPEEWAGRNLVLHFGAVDYDATVWVDGREVGRHRGGFSSFDVQLGRFDPERPEANRLSVVVRARDLRESIQARGKQSLLYDNTGCLYTRTTGIWQTVWLEPVPEDSIRSIAVTPSVGDGSFAVVAELSANRPGQRVRAVLSDGAGVVAEATVRADLDFSPALHLKIPKDRVRLWRPADPFLYDLTVELLNGDEALDSVRSYTGLRSVSRDGKRLLLNGEPVFQRLVLDQGYWPESLMTAPSDDALRRDIELAMAAGFNGARLHQKVFEERYLYHADRLGYLVWGEFGDWGVSENGPAGQNQAPTASFVGEWLEALRRDYNHPAIVGWCPLNETHQVMHDRTTVLDDVTRALFLATKNADRSRPVLDASGYSHRVSEADVFDSHDYEQKPERFAQQHAGLATDEPFVNTGSEGPFSVPYRGQPYFVSEFGGIWWNPELAATEHGNSDSSWGYGQRVADEDELYERFAGLVGALLDDPNMFGYCYTQLTDVFQEQNGIYRFDRSEKLDIARIREAQQRPAAFES